MWLEEYGDTLPKDHVYGTELDNSMSKGKGGSTEGNDSRAQFQAKMMWWLPVG